MKQGPIGPGTTLARWYARRDSNPRTRLRRPALYPTELRAHNILIIGHQTRDFKARPLLCSTSHLPQDPMTLSGPDVGASAPARSPLRYSPRHHVKAQRRPGREWLAAAMEAAHRPPRTIPVDDARRVPTSEC